MITIGSKNKILLFDIAVEGIDNENLEFWFRIYDENITYSFKGEQVEHNKVKVVIPPLTEMINSKYLAISKTYPASMEVIGEGKYNVTTWSDMIELEAPAHVDIKLEQVKEEIKKIVKENITPVKKETKIQMKMLEMADEEKPKLVPVSSGTPMPKVNPPCLKSVKDVKQYRNNLLRDILSKPISEELKENGNKEL